MFSLRKHKTKIWILLIGIAFGFLLAVRLDFLPDTQAEYGQATQTRQDGQSLQTNFVRVAKEVGPAVVSISTERRERVGSRRYFQFFGDDEFDHFFDQFFRDFFGEVPGQEYKQRGLGSGFIIDQQGYILTNQHVIKDADKITVTLPDGRKFKAELKGSDVRSDLAVVKIAANNLPVLQLGDSDQVKIGQWAIAVGNPFGFVVESAEPTVTVGIISATNRSFGQGYQEHNYTDLIQTDAAINPGNSGGPLVNIHSEVIGINVAIFTPSGGNIGIGFAIPANNAKHILSRLVSGKEILYGWLGVNVQDLDSELASYFGVADEQGALIMEVLEDSPAEDAGFKEGDIIKKFSGRKIEDVRSLLSEVGKAEVDRLVVVEIIREKRAFRLSVKVGQRPGDSEQLAQTPDLKWRGMRVSEITTELANRYRIQAKQGVVITAIEPDSPADAVGLLPGDLIVAINNLRIKDVESYQSAIKTVENAVLIRTERGFVVLKNK